LIYLDATALVTLIAGRHYVDELRDFLADRPAMPMGTSTIGYVEAVRTLNTIGDYPTAMADLERSFTEVLVTDEVRDVATRVPSGVRSLDAVHIASALVVGRALDALVTYDKRMLEVARSMGLPTAAPGLETGR
jgi:predicted nucleic acid-binding protein